MDILLDEIAVTTAKSYVYLGDISGNLKSGRPRLTSKYKMPDEPHQALKYKKVSLSSRTYQMLSFS